MGFDEEKIVNNCRYHLANQNIFEPKKLRLLQHIKDWRDLTPPNFRLRQNTRYNFKPSILMLLRRIDPHKVSPTIQIQDPKSK
jgi:hypothetical protein